MKRKYYIGVDGGASKTEVALLNHKGGILNLIKGQGCHIGVRVSKNYGSLLKTLIAKVRGPEQLNIKHISGFGFGLCGYDFPKEYKGQKSSLLKHLEIEDSKTTLVNDGVAALWAGASSGPAVIIQIGTGYTAAYRSELGKEVPFDQVNCGVAVNPRRDFYITAARVMDGREKKSVIPALMMKYFDVYDPDELIQKLGRKRFPKEKVANILPVWTRAIKKNDRVAIGLLERTAKSYAHDIGVMINMIGKPRVEVVLGGGVLLNGPPMLLRKIGENVRRSNPGARVHKPYLPPAAGAALMAAYHDKADVKRMFAEAKKSV